ncbi:glycosyltransferase family 2 protein [Candidatus Pelagibacter communis]|uniref:glycosyltransferase family 2 protein n=1 Tax=Pelagibacter ubique TaxID=198252 RepID=UPI00094C57EC|nr:glycosyltransferase family 2 protein [Candidatus Pelagibacter ubique]
MNVSIILTNFNYSKFLKQSIESCLNQDFDKKKFEVIFVDDNSTDNSIEIANKYLKFKNFRIFKNKKNLGVAESSNKAILKARSKYIVRVDADDFISNDFIKMLFGYLKNNKNLFCVACDYQYFFSKQKKTKIISAREKPISCGIMYNRSKLISLGLYDKKFKHREEEELRERLGDRYQIQYLELPLYFYRMHKSNKTKHNDYINIYKTKLENIRNKNKLGLLKSKLGKKPNVIVIIPARGGSKRLKRKNLYNVWNKPMIYWSIMAAKKSKLVKAVYVTSENEEIINYSKKIGAKIINRPQHLSGDYVFKMDAIVHATKEISKTNKPNIVISLQANSPQVTHHDIDKCILHLVKYNLSEVISVDKNNNQNGALRVMKYQAVFQKTLSTYAGFVRSDIIDVHTNKDVISLSNLKK